VKIYEKVKRQEGEIGMVWALR